MSNVPMTRPEEMLAEHRTDYNRGSTFVRRQDGSILQLQSPKFLTSNDDGITWSEPFEKRDAAGDLVGGSSLVNLSGNGIGLAGNMRDEDAGSPEEVDRSGHMVFRRSEDGGETWEAPVRATPENVHTGDFHDTMIRTSSGRLIMPVYGVFGRGTRPDEPMPARYGRLLKGQWVATPAHYSDPIFSYSYVCLSDDDGRTWKRNRDGEMFIQRDENATISYTNEPSVAEVGPGVVLIFLRTGLGRLFQAWSHDDGDTWTRPQPTSLASGTAPANIRVLPNGHLLAVWNQHGEEDIKRGYTRTRMSSAISRNGGSVWEFFQNVTSIHEETRVEPGPIRRTGPAEYTLASGKAAPELDTDYVEPADGAFGSWTYPSVLVLDDRVIISHRYFDYREDTEKAQLNKSNPKDDSAGFIQVQKVLPLSWFYGGKEPADNPALPRSAAP